jgi:Zn-dependent M28 family amino/carboxypeptidase
MRIANSQIKHTKHSTILILIFFTTAILTSLILAKPSTARKFSGESALKHVKYQVSLGPRFIGSEAHLRAREYIETQLALQGWDVSVENVAINENLTIHNIVGRRGEGRPWIILGAHYDTRLLSDKDPDPLNRSMPVPGANDGASGVGVLLELASVIPKNINKQIWLTFFDAEDNGNIPGYDWIIGSQAFASALKSHPDAVVIVDMVGDVDLEIYLEKNSDPILSREIWGIAEELGHTEFILAEKHRILDDHLPFVNLGIPAVDIIDIEYPYWHTTDDTLDKVSSQSLEAVGETLLVWLLSYE